jgi:hypothetical protein
MLIVRTYIAPSKIHGMGVFTAEPIEEGARVWVFDPTVDQEITADELAALPDTAREIALSRSFVRENGRLSSRGTTVCSLITRDVRTFRARRMGALRCVT